MFSFAWPLIFILLPLPWLIQRFVPAARLQDSAALNVPFFHDIKTLQTSNFQKHALRHGKMHLVAYAIWILLLLATAGPQWLGTPIELPRSGRNIMLAVDLSGSMQIPDMIDKGRQITRLNMVKQVASQFIKGRVGDRLGLILFGSRAYLQTPLTHDRNTLNAQLQDATIGLAGRETAIGDGIGLAIKRLKQASKKSRVLILLTDGANNSGTLAPLEAAKVAGSLGIKIYTIGIGADKMIVQGLFGPQTINPSNDLNERDLQAIAAITGGKFFRAKNKAALETIYKELDKLEPVKNKHSVFQPRNELYPWPLALAFLLTLFIGVRRGVTSQIKTEKHEQNEDLVGGTIT